MQTPQATFSIQICTVTCLLLGSIVGHAQEAFSLLEYDSFFQAQRPQMQSWVNEKVGGRDFQISDIHTEHQTVSLHITGTNSCAHTQAHWTRAEAKNAQLGKQMLLRWSFLAEVPQDEAIVEVQCCEQKHFYRRFVQPKPLADGLVAKSAMPFLQIMPLAFGAQGDAPAEPSTTNSDPSELNATVANAPPAAVCEKVRSFLTNKYSSLPKARYIWDAELKYTDISDTEFQLEVTYITNVITSERYYEYHKINVSALPSGANTALQVRLMAKYGSGIVFAPRRNDYKDMESAYKTDLGEYRTIFFKQIVYYAGKK
jgi:hypothetical protein